MFGLLNLIPTAIGLINGYEANKRAHDAANQAQAEQLAAQQRQQQLADSIMQSYNRDVATGVYDPSKRIGDLGHYLGDMQTRSLNNQSALAKSFGYQSGDSEPTVGQDAIKFKYADEFNNQANQIANELNQRQQSAFQYANSAAMQANSSAAGIAQNQFNNSVANRVNLAPALGGLQSFLAAQQQPINPQAPKPAATSQTPMPVSGGSASVSGAVNPYGNFGGFAYPGMNQIGTAVAGSYF